MWVWKVYLFFALSFCLFSILDFLPIFCLDWKHSIVRRIAQNTWQNSTSSSSSQPQAAFVKSFEKLVKEAHNLTQSYQNEIGKWKAHQYDNKTMISVTSNYLPKYENLVNDPKRCSLPSNTKMLQIYIQRVLNRSFKVIFISGIIYRQIILLRMNCLQNFWMTHSNSKLTLKALKSSGMFRIVPWPGHVTILYLALWGQ